MGWAIASIAVGVAILLSLRPILGWMGAADDEPLARESRRLMPAWLTPRRERLIRAAWVVGVALIFVAMGIGALV